MVKSSRRTSMNINIVMDILMAMKKMSTGMGMNMERVVNINIHTDMAKEKEANPKKIMP